MATRTGLRVRAKIDYWKFVARHEWPFVLALVGVLLGVGEFLPSAAALALSVVAVGLGLVQLVSDVRDVNRRWSAYEFVPTTELFPVGTVPLTDVYQAPVRHVVGTYGTAVSDDAIDTRLRSTRPAATVVDDDYRLPSNLRETAPQVLGTTVGGGVVFNGSVLGLSDDPTSATDGRAIRLHRARFFDGQCSNELCRFTIRHRSSGEIYDMRRHALLDTTGRLAALAETDLANIVGISTIALTSDGLVVLIEQTTRNSASAALLAPSGSGSLEPRDAEGLQPGWALQDLLIRGMNRELTEETGIAPGDIVETSVVGYARWLERGAKPEFFGLTRLGVSAAAIESAQVRGAERLYSGGASFVEIDLSALGRELRAGHQAASAPALPVAVRERGSVPLVLALRAAALALDGDVADETA